MAICTRCGIDIFNPPICDDCADVEHLPRSVSTHIIELPNNNGYRVGTTRRSGAPIPNRETVLQAVRDLTLRGRSLNEIAAHVGVTDRTITRMRRELGVTPPRTSPWEHMRDPETHRAEVRANIAKIRTLKG